MANKYKVGEVVQLKSGGPAMTVDELTSSDRYRCVWFKGASREQGVFSEDTLSVFIPPSA
jgi:uncharacterized protein YodC (DUF2158 family)